MTQILVFEPDHAFAMELRTELTKLGCTVQVFSDGNAGLDAANQQRPDLILLTVELPRVNGFSICNKLKKDPVLRTVPLIILSAQSSPETFEQHRKLPQRAEDYVHKPIAFRDLLVRVQAFVPIGDDEEPEGILDEVTSQVDLDELVIVEESTGEVATLQAEKSADLQAVLRAAAKPKLNLDIPAARNKLATDHLPQEPQPGPAAFALEFDDDEGVTQLTPRPSDDVAARIAAAAAGIPPGQVVSPDSAPPVPAPPAPGTNEPVPPSVPSAPGSFPAAPPSAPSAPGSLPEAPISSPGAMPAPPTEDFAMTRVAPASSGKTAATRRSILEVERLRKELDAARKELSKVGHHSAVSAEELLELRGTLQERDKELLALREQLAAKDHELGAKDHELGAKEGELRQQLSAMEGAHQTQIHAKDRELLDARDEMLGHERSAAELQPMLTKAERQASEALARIEALTADKALADKRALDFKTGAKKIAEQLNSRGIELKEQRASYEKSAESLKTKHEHATRESEEGHRQELATAEEAHQQELQKIQQDTELKVAQELARLQQESSNNQAQFEELAEQREAELKAELAKAQQAIQDSEELLRQLETEHAAQLEQLQQSSTAALEELEGKHAAAIENAAATSQQALAELGTSQQEKLQLIEGALEQAAADAQAKRDQLREEQQRQLETAERENAEALQQAGKDFQTKLAEVQSALEAKEKEHAGIVDALEEENGALQLEQERLNEQVGTLEGQNAELGGERDALNERVTELESAHGELETQATTLTKERDGLEAIVVKHETRIAKLDSDLKARAAEHDKLAGELEQAKSDLLAVGTERDSAVKDEREAGEKALAEQRESADKTLKKEQLRLKKALNRWGREREALAKARESLSAVVTQLASTESKAIESDDEES